MKVSLKRQRSSSADRQRRYRARLKAGKIRVSFDTDEVDHIERLIAAGYLTAEQSDDRQAINEATRELVESLKAAHIVSVTRNATT